VASGTLAADPPDGLGADLSPASWRGRRLAPLPWALALAVTTPLATAYVVLAPASGDLAAATYRGDLFARFGFTLWDNGWYGGHYLPGYSLLAPALGSLVGERLLLGLCTIAAAGLFGLLAQHTFQSAGARVAGGSFALGACAGLLSGRVAFGLGLSVGLLALLMLMRGWTVPALASAVLTSLASPVAGAFLALAGLTCALTAAPFTHDARAHDRRAGSRQRSRSLALAVAATAPILALALAFPEGGWEPFAPSLFWPVLAGVVLIALALPRAGDSLGPGPRKLLTWGAWLYALLLIGAFMARSPVGGNAARLGALLGAPLAAGVLWERRRLALALLAPALLYWQLETPISDFAAVAGTPSVNASYYAPLVAQLMRRARGRPLRVEVPMTEAHWESVYLPEQPLILLARGWERQLDTRYAALFYGPRLTASAYRSWLEENAVSYVALPDVSLDSAGEQEGKLIARGLPYLVELWHSAHWRLFAVRGATPLAQPPAILTGVGPDSFTILASRPGAFTVRLHFTPYWALQLGRGSVRRATGGWTEVDTRRAGVVRVGIE
jgi:putative Mn2+ efflux pump MntP